MEIKTSDDEADPRRWATTGTEYPYRGGGPEARLVELAALEPGWLDGEGAAVQPSALDAARALLAVLAAAGVPLPRIYPTPSGAVQFEWHGPGVEVILAGTYLELGGRRFRLMIEEF